MTGEASPARTANDGATPPTGGSGGSQSGAAKPRKPSKPNLAPLDAPAREKLRNFGHVLANTALANVTTSYLWFALSFWVYLETRSVFAAAIIGGSYMLLVSVFGIVFGVLVDRMRKKAVMALSAAVTLACYLVAGAVFLAASERELVDWRTGWFWVFAAIVLVGSVVENLRNIALSTTVTLLVPADRRDRANGLVGATQGIAFLVTSVFSGLSIGLLGMGPTLLIATLVTAAAAAHLLFVRIPEPRPITAAEAAQGGVDAAGTADGIAGEPGVDATADALASSGAAPGAAPVVPPGPAGFRGVIPAVLAVPGLLALILFTTFNNLVGGVFMALMDPYGLTLFPVELWGIVLGVTSVGFIVGGAIVAKTGLGGNPVRTLLLVNLGVAVIGGVFTLREWWWLYAVGIFVFMCIMPAAEAAEQTIIQRVVPFDRQGRVFGFAASVESASTPIAAFLIGPIAEFAIIPFMDTREGQASFGWLLGDGDARGIALVFVLSSAVMFVTVALAFLTPQYRRLSHTYAETSSSIAADDDEPDAGDEPVSDASDNGATEDSLRSYNSR